MGEKDCGGPAEVSPTYRTEPRRKGTRALVACPRGSLDTNDVTATKKFWPPRATVKDFP